MSKGGFKELAKEAIQNPLEAMVQVGKSKSSLTIGIPKEISPDENRVPFTPDTIRLLSSIGFNVIIESGAGKRALFSDLEYSEAGALIAQNKEEIYSSNFIVKITLPDINEINLLHPGQVLFSAINSPNVSLNHLNLLIKKKITAFCFENIRDNHGDFPIVQSMSEIAGKAVLFIASEYLSEKGKGTLITNITGISPVKIIILGAGTVGQHAARLGIALGADVHVYDDSIYRLRRLSNMLPVNLKNSILQPFTLAKELENADIVIGALRPVFGRTPCVVTTEMVSRMKERSLIMDVSIDHGGCFETSELTTLQNPTFIKYGIIHYCVPNIPSKFPGTASIALSNSLMPVFQEIAYFDQLQTYLWDNSFARNGLYIYKGILTDAYLGEKYNIGYKNIDLLLTSNL